MTIATVSALIDALDASQLLPAEHRDELARLRQRFTDPRSLARTLLERGWLTSYQVNQLFRGRAAELLLGPYVILERLGEGGVGQVFKARHHLMNRTVALKVVRPELLKDPETVDRFQREIQVVSQLTHPNVVHAYDAGPIGANFFLAMELVEGTDLARLVQQNGKLPCAEASEYIRQAALGLQHIHERGLVHRDIKPHNLLVSGLVLGGAVGSGAGASSRSTHHSPLPAHHVVKILDLGLARLQRPVDRDASRGVTAAGTVLGTVDYMAPEQALDFRQVDCRADIYSLGCTFYHLLVGRPPFPDGSAAQKLLRHQQAEPTPLAQVRPDLPAHLAALIRKMMAKRPADRCQTAAEVVAVLSGSRSGAAAVALVADTRLRAAERTIDGNTGITPVTPLAPLALLVSDDGRPLAAAIPLTAHRGRWLTNFVTTSGQKLGFKGVAALLALGLALLLLLVLWPRSPKVALPPERLPSPEETTEADLKRLKSRFADYAADPDSLRRYLLAVRRVHAGDPRALQAVELFGLLPSPLDKLDGKNVSADDRPYGKNLDGLVAVFGDQRLRHWALARSVSLSPDGQLLASAGDDNLVRLWDPVTGKQVRALQHAKAVHWVGFSHGGARLVAMEGETMKWWETATGKEVPAPTGRFLGVSPDGKLVATSEGNVVRLWLAASGQERSTFSGHAKGVWSLGFSADGQLAATSSDDPTILVWETATGKLRHSLKGQTKHTVRLQFAAGDKLLASWEHETKILRLWEVAAEKEQLAVPAHHNWDLAADGKTLAIYGPESQVRLWDVAAKKERATLKHPGWPFGMLFSPDGEVLATGTTDGNVKLWDVATATERTALVGTTGPLSTWLFTADSKGLVSANKDGAVKLWDLATGSERQPGRARPDWFTAATFSHDGQTLALNSGNSVKLFDTATARERGATTGHTGPVSSVVFAPDDQLLATGSHDGNLKLWNVASGGLLWTLAHGHAIAAVAFAPDGKTVFSAGETKVHLWDPSTGQQRSTLQRGKEHGIASMTLAPSGKILAVGYHDGSVGIWDLPAAKMRFAFPGGGRNIPIRLAFTPDGRFVACRSNEDAVVRLWDIEANKERFTLPPLAGGWALAPDSRTLTVGFQSGRLQVWDLNTGKIRLPLEEQPKQVTSVAYAPDGRRLVSSGLDGRVILWDPDSPRRKVRDWQFPGPVQQAVLAPDGRHVLTINGNGTASLLRLAAPP